MKIGYAPYEPVSASPAIAAASPTTRQRAGSPFELADPSRDYDVVVVTPRADLGAWIVPAGRTRSSSSTSSTRISRSRGRTRRRS